jgi:hypothetical protein
MNNKNLFLFFFVVSLFLGCIETEEWNVFVIEDTVEEYSLASLQEYGSESVRETVVEEEIKTIEWTGTPAALLGDGDIINYFSTDLYMVSIPSNVAVILAYEKEGDTIPEEDGGPLKIAVDPHYGCKCNWLKYLKVVEFVDRENTLSISGEVFNILYFSPRDLNIFYSLDDLRAATYNSARLNDILDKALCKDKAASVTFITENGRTSFDLATIREKDLEVIYENGFAIPLLQLTQITAIRVE